MKREIKNIYFGSITINWFSIYFSLFDKHLLCLVVYYIIVSFYLGSAHIIIRNIHSILGILKWVNPQGFFPWVSSVYTKRLNACTEFQFLFYPFGIVWVSLRFTLINLQSGLINSAKYSWLMTGPKLGRS